MINHMRDSAPKLYRQSAIKLAFEDLAECGFTLIGVAWVALLLWLVACWLA